MEIIKLSDNLTKKDVYLLSRSPKIQKMSDNVGAQISVDKYMLYSDVSGDGSKEVTILSISNGEAVYATNSATAIREFEEILNIMDGEHFAVEIISGTSKNNRAYITLALV